MRKDVKTELEELIDAQKFSFPVKISVNDRISNATLISLSWIFKGEVYGLDRRLHSIENSFDPQAVQTGMLTRIVCDITDYINSPYINKP
jgi:hypothetical protein